jgi:hypothetical protein
MRKQAFLEPTFEGAAFWDSFRERKPVRRVVTKRRKRIVGKVVSAKMGRLIPWESQLERDYMYLLEANPQVIAYFAQPERLPYLLRGQRHTYVPDLEIVWTDNRRSIEEVKYEEDAADPENQEAFAVFRRLYAEDGITYRVVTETTIRRQPQLSNVRKLLRHRLCRPSPAQMKAVDRLISGTRSATYDELVKALAALADSPADLLGWLILNGHFDFDRSRHLTLVTPITPTWRAAA